MFVCVEVGGGGGGGGGGKEKERQRRKSLWGSGGMLPQECLEFIVEALKCHFQ